MELLHIVYALLTAVAIGFGFVAVFNLLMAFNTPFRNRVLVAHFAWQQFCKICRREYKRLRTTPCRKVKAWRK